MPLEAHPSHRVTASALALVQQCPGPAVNAAFLCRQGQESELECAWTAAVTKIVTGTDSEGHSDLTGTVTDADGLSPSASDSADHPPTRTAKGSQSVRHRRSRSPQS